MVRTMAPELAGVQSILPLACWGVVVTVDVAIQFMP
jgi:hypothetical protein